RTQKAYNLLTKGEGEAFDSPKEALQSSYDEDVTDEFITPKLIDQSPESRIRPDDVVIFYNIRGDRARHITRAFTVDGLVTFDTGAELLLLYTTFISNYVVYDVEVDMPLYYL